MSLESFDYLANLRTDHLTKPLFLDAGKIDGGIVIKEGAHK